MRTVVDVRVTIVASSVPCLERLRVGEDNFILVIDAKLNCLKFLELMTYIQLTDDEGIPIPPGQWYKWFPALISLKVTSMPLFPIDLSKLPLEVYSHNEGIVTLPPSITHLEARDLPQNGYPPHLTKLVAGRVDDRVDLEPIIRLRDLRVLKIDRPLPINAQDVVLLRQLPHRMEKLVIIDNNYELSGATSFALWYMQDRTGMFGEDIKSLKLMAKERERYLGTLTIMREAYRNVVRIDLGKKKRLKS